jgi:CheY-like chemotaxis protein
MAHILVIDDDPDARDLFATIVGAAGHEVRVASDGDEGIRLCRRQRPDVILVDIFMPAKDGIEVVMEVRRDFWPARIVAVSAGWRLYPEHGNPFDVLDFAVFLGADLALRKPVAPETLLRAIDTVLERPASLPRA